MYTYVYICIFIYSGHDMYNRTRLHNVYVFGGLLFYTTHVNILTCILPYPYFVHLFSVYHLVTIIQY